MGSNEEYLDSLLKSVVKENVLDTGKESPDEKKKEKPVPAAESKSVMSAEEIDAMFAAAEMVAGGQAAQEQKIPDTVEEPEMAFIPDAVEEPGKALFSDTAEEPEMAEGADIADLLKLVGNSERAGFADTSDNSDMADFPDISDSGTAGFPDVSDLDTAGFPDVSDNSDMAGLPDMADISDILGSMLSQEAGMPEEHKEEAAQDTTEGAEPAFDAQDLLDTIGAWDLPEEEDNISEDREEQYSSSSEEPDNGKLTVAGTQNMSAEEIEQLLSGTSDLESADEADEISPFALDAEDNGGNEELDEINDLLMKSDNNEPVDQDMIALLEGLKEDQTEAEEAEPQIEEAAEEAQGKKNRKNRKEKREKRRKKKKEPEETDITEGEAEGNPFIDNLEGNLHKEVKKGFFRKLLEKLTAEEEEDQEPLDENQAIMQELDAEDKAEQNKKNKKKGKSKKGAVEEEDEEDNGKAKAKKKKPAKPVKVKKEKIKKEPLEPEKPGKKLSKRSVFVIVLFSGTLLAGVLIVNALFNNLQLGHTAGNAFQNKDYAACYESLNGVKRNAEQESMLNYSKVILKMQQRIDIYNGYLALEKELEAVDSLMRAVAGYDELYGIAQKWNAAPELETIYQQVLNILSENYGLSEADAREIANSAKDVDYTRRLTALVSGEPIEPAEAAGSEPAGLQDVLPEETELPQANFVQ